MGVDSNPRCGKLAESSISTPLPVGRTTKPLTFSFRPTPLALPIGSNSAAFVPPTFLYVTPTPGPFPKRVYRAVSNNLHPVRKTVPPTFTPTPTWFFVSRTTAEPFQSEVAQINSVAVLPSPVSTPTPEPAPDQGQTIVFGQPPANLYLNFADGPGLYRLEVFDKDGKSVRVLMEKKIVAQKDMWVEWDGKNDQAVDASEGIYSVILSKEGRQLQKISVLRTTGDH